MLYVCLKCGNWTVLGILAEIMAQWAQQQSDVRIQRMCPECQQEMHKVEAEERLRIVESLQINAEDSDPTLDERFMGR